MKFVTDQLQENALRYPDRIAVSYKNHTITYFELNKKSNQLAHVLLNKGIHGGDTVYLFLNKSIQKTIALYAIMKCGAAAAIVNRSYKAEHINQILKDSYTPLMVTNEMLLGPIRRELGMINTLILPVHDNADYPRINATEPGVHKKPGDTGIVLFTSGSEGIPKGVKISHKNLFQRVRGEIKSFKLSPADTILNILPFSFDVGLNQLLTSITAGAQLVLHDFIFVRSVLTCIKSNHVTGFSAVPTFWIKLLSERTLLQSDHLKSLRYVTISGGSLSKKHLVQLLNLLKGVEIIKTYGQTETFRSTMLFCRSVENTDKIFSIGRVIPGVKLIVFDFEKKRLCLPGEPGELVHMGEGIMKGYSNPVHTDKKVVTGSSLGLERERSFNTAVLTGDIGFVDEDGYVFYQGRKDALLKIAGYRVYPREIEHILLKHPHITDVVVWGEPDKQSEISLSAAITTDTTQKISTADVLAYCKKKCHSI